MHLLNLPESSFIFVEMQLLPSTVAAILAVLLLPGAYAASIPRYPKTGNSSSCRNMPGDASWPSFSEWDFLNQTVGGRLIAAQPLAQPCYGTTRDAVVCAKLQEEWITPEP